MKTLTFDIKKTGQIVVFIGIFFQSRVRECIARNEKREMKVPVKAIPFTQNKLQLPDYAEGFDKLYFVRINDNEFEITDWRE